MMGDFGTWVGSGEVSLREKIAQLVFVRIGSNMPPVKRVEADEERVARLLERCPVGGLALFNGGPETTAVLQRLQSRSRLPLLVASDIERGVGQQVHGYTLFPHSMALGRLDAGLDHFVEATVCEAREAGIHITLAPVADVATNPLNPIISIRAFSEDVERATRFTAEFVKRGEEGGLLTTAKHFPGHGDTHQDSHDSLPSVEKTIDELWRCELRPFRAAIEAGCSLIMTAHVAYPKVDPSGRPATLSLVLLQTLLREQMGFRGVVCSDSLLMAGVRDLFPEEGAMALAALEAGVDLLLDLVEPEAVVDYLVSGVERGALRRERVDEAFARVMGLKQKVFGGRSRGVSEPGGGSLSQSMRERFAASSRRVAMGAIEILDNSRPALPFRAAAITAAIVLKPIETAIDPAEQPLAAALRGRFSEVRFAQLGPRSDQAAYESAGEITRSAEQLLVAMINRPAAWHAFGLRAEQKRFIEAITRERSDVVLASLGAPHALRDYPDAAVRVCTYSDVSVSQEALAEFLLVG